MIGEGRKGFDCGGYCGLGECPGCGLGGVEGGQADGGGDSNSCGIVRAPQEARRTCARTS